MRPIVKFQTKQLLYDHVTRFRPRLSKSLIYIYYLTYASLFYNNKLNNKKKLNKKIIF